MSDVDFLVVGHVTEDEDAARVRLGGPAAYAALTAARLGARPALLTSAGWEPGLVDTLKGVRVARYPAAATTRFVNRYRRGRRWQRLQALAEPLEPRHVPAEWRQVPSVLLAPVAQEVDPTFVASFPTALLGLIPQGWLRAWDNRGRVFPTAWDDADQALHRADAVILSEQDLPSRSRASLVRHYAAVARLLVVTRGSSGAEVYADGARLHSPAFRPARVVDPTGAGDVFAAAFLLRYGQTRDAVDAADFANCVASFVVEKLGLEGVPTPEQVAERLAKGARAA